MVYKVMPTMPVSELRKRQSELVALVRETPLLLTHNGYAAGILIHPQVWNDLMEAYEEQLKINPPTVDISDCLSWEEFQNLQTTEVVVNGMG